MQQSQQKNASNVYSLAPRVTWYIGSRCPEIEALKGDYEVLELANSTAMPRGLSKNAYQRQFCLFWYFCFFGIATSPNYYSFDKGRSATAPPQTDMRRLDGSILDC